MLIGVDHSCQANPPLAGSSSYSTDGGSLFAGRRHRDDVGPRTGGSVGAYLGSVDLDARIVVVHQSLAWNGNTPYLKSTKTRNTRTLDMPARTVDALRDHRKRQIEERPLMGDRWRVEWSGPIFVSEAGTPLRAMPASRAPVSPYSLRHTATSLLSASGVAPELLADLLGHKDTRMVHHHYRRPVTPTISVARDRRRTHSEVGARHEDSDNTVRAMTR